MSRGFPDKSNPFAEDDNPWERKRPGGFDSGPGYGGASTGGFGADDDLDARFLEVGLQEQKQESMNRQLEGTERALASIYESQRMGIATAEELVHQGEQLDNIEKRTDQINSTMKSSQKHLNSIKSVFGGIRNWWNKGKDAEKQAEEETEDADRQPKARSDRLQAAMDSDRAISEGDRDQVHPAMRVRQNDTSGFYVDDSGFGGPQQGAAGFGYQQEQTFDENRSNYEKQFNKNVDMMSGGMAQLKNLALGLGDEIDRQDDQLDRLGTKFDKTNTVLDDQNRQMRKILYK